MKRLTFIEHLEELRLRMIKSIVLIIAASVIVYNFTDKILSFVARPAVRLIFIAPAEALIVRLKIALFGGLFLASPFVLWQIWGFVSDGLGKKEGKHVLLFGLFSFIFFIFGSLFGYFIIVPIGMDFLLAFATDFIVPMITVDRYVSFAGCLSLAFGLSFQFPLIILFLTKIGAVTPQSLSKRRKYAVVIIFIIGAIFTPPDIITQCLMALPLLLLYEVSILLSRLIYR